VYNNTTTIAITITFSSLYFVQVVLQLHIACVWQCVKTHSSPHNLQCTTITVSSLSSLSLFLFFHKPALLTTGLNCGVVSHITIASLLVLNRYGFRRHLVYTCLGSLSTWTLQPVNHATSYTYPTTITRNIPISTRSHTTLRTMSDINKSLTAIEQQPLQTHTATVFFMHGLGDSGAGWCVRLDE
jgi:hypothetical protein